jgi:hypothetical protein
MSEMPAVPDDNAAREGGTASDTSADAARRETLKRLGVYGALIAPALVAALTSPASAQAVVDSGATN